MPVVNNTSVSNCVCAFVDRLGPAKQVFTAFIDALIAQLQVLKVFEQLASCSLEDYARKALLEVALEIQRTATENVAAGINTVVGLASASADCPPLAVYLRKVKKWRDDLLADFYDKEYEIQQYIDAIDEKQKKVAGIQKAIDWLLTFKDAIDACGT